MVALFALAVPKVKEFVIVELTLTVADATPGTPDVTSPVIVAESPVVLDQLDVTVVPLVCAIFKVWSRSLLFLNICSMVPKSESAVIVAWGMATILCTEPARWILVHFTAAELYSRFHGRCRERPQGALERM